MILFLIPSPHLGGEVGVTRGRAEVDVVRDAG